MKLVALKAKCTCKLYPKESGAVWSKIVQGINPSFSEQSDLARSDEYYGDTLP